MVQLEIRTIFPNTVKELLERNNVKKGDSITIPGTDSTLEYLDHPTRGIIGSEESLNFLLNFGTGFSSSLIAAWLYNKLNGKAISLTMDDTEIKIDKDEIKIEIEKRSKDLQSSKKSKK
jgi:hypothetical protein